MARTGATASSAAPERRDLRPLRARLHRLRPGRDIYHVPISLKKAYRFVNCEKVDRRTESDRGGGLKPLP